MEPILLTCAVLYLPSVALLAVRLIAVMNRAKAFASQPPPSLSPLTDCALLIATTLRVALLFYQSATFVVGEREALFWTLVEIGFALVIAAFWVLISSFYFFAHDQVPTTKISSTPRRRRYVIASAILYLLAQTSLYVQSAITAELPQYRARPDYSLVFAFIFDFATTVLATVVFSICVQTASRIVRSLPRPTESVKTHAGKFAIASVAAIFGASMRALVFIVLSADAIARRVSVPAVLFGTPSPVKVVLLVVTELLPISVIVIVTQVDWRPSAFRSPAPSESSSRNSTAETLLPRPLND
jgi:hypothetical protein